MQARGEGQIVVPFERRHTSLRALLVGQLEDALLHVRNTLNFLAIGSATDGLPVERTAKKGIRQHHQPQNCRSDHGSSCYLDSNYAGKVRRFLISVSRRSISSSRSICAKRSSSESPESSPCALLIASPRITLSFMRSKVTSFWAEFIAAFADWALPTTRERRCCATSN